MSQWTLLSIVEYGHGEVQITSKCIAMKPTIVNMMSLANRMMSSPRISSATTIGIASSHVGMVYVELGVGQSTMGLTECIY